MTELESRLNELLQNAASAGVVTRASAAVVSADGPIADVSLGTLEGKPISSRTIFDAASVTKCVPVSALALKAVDSGMVDLDTPVIELVPEAQLRCKRPPTLKHLLTQTLDFGFSLAALKNEKPETLRHAVLTAELKSEPGEKFSYCNASSIILGMAVEKVYEKSLDAAAKEHLFTPLGMNSTCFRPDESLVPNIVPTEICDWRKRPIQGEIHDESAWVLNSLMIPGAAGIFTTTQDLGKFITMILNDGDGFFTPGFIRSCARNHIEGAQGGETGLGFEYNQPYMGDLRSAQTIGKTGFTGSVITADLEKGVGFALLTDYTWPKRKPAKDAVMELRKQCSDLVWKFAVRD